MQLPTIEGMLPGQLVCILLTATEIDGADWLCCRGHCTSVLPESTRPECSWYNKRFCLFCRHHYVGVLAKDTVLTPTRYRQMAGRAGRAGIDTQGEAILMASNASLGKHLLTLMQVARSAADLQRHSLADN